MLNQICKVPIYYDMNDNKWIRSGKVTGRGFDVRHKEHKKIQMS